MSDAPGARPPSEDDRLAEAQAAVGHRFADRALLAEALRHASAAGPGRPSNERMEFLGDAVIDLVVAEALHARHPDRPEGELSPMKSAAVSRESCAAAAGRLGLGAFLRLGPGMGKRGGPAATLQGNAFEAVVAAVFLDAGLAAARPFVLEHLGPEIERAGVSVHHRNFKSALQDFAQAWLGGRALYEGGAVAGPKHRPVFEVFAFVGDLRFPAVQAASKKKAEQAAAEAALHHLRAEPGGLPADARDRLEELLQK